MLDIYICLFVHLCSTNICGEMIMCEALYTLPMELRDPLTITMCSLIPSDLHLKREIVCLVLRKLTQVLNKKNMIFIKFLEIFHSRFLLITSLEINIDSLLYIWKNPIFVSLKKNGTAFFHFQTFVTYFIFYSITLPTVANGLP